MSPVRIRQAVSLVLSALLCASVPAQQPQLSSTAPNAIVRPDPKRAEKLAERGEKAEADGRNDEEASPLHATQLRHGQVRIRTLVVGAGCAGWTMARALREFDGSR